MDKPESNTEQLKSLSQSVQEFISSFEKLPKTFAVLYAPDKCYLALVDAAGNFLVKDNINKFSVDKIFEARVFNSKKELRWLNGYGEAIISDAIFRDDKKFAGTIDQSYLLWGQSTGKADGDWTEFATARIGSFYVPLSKVPHQGYAKFTAVEYLKKYEDGNVAVVDERLTGIESYKGE